MSKFHPLAIPALLSCAAIGFLPASAVAQVVPSEQPFYANCQYGFAAIFPGDPQGRDVAYTTASGASVSARQFYVERGADQYLVTVVEFPNGPPADEAIVDHAADQLRKRGEVRFQGAGEYDPGMPGRQLNIFEPNNRQTRASVYMANRRLFITAAHTAVGDFPALQFEQSITLINNAGLDIDDVAPSGEDSTRVFACR